MQRIDTLWNLVTSKFVIGLSVLFPLLVLILVVELIMFLIFTINHLNHASPLLYRHVIDIYN